MSRYDDTSRYELGVTMHAHCLNRNVDPMMDSLQKMLQESDWSNRANLTTLLQQTASHMRENLTSSGHSYAMKTAAAGMGRLHEISEMWSGMTQVSFVSKLAQEPDPDVALDLLLADFAAIEKHVADSSIVRAQVNAEESVDLTRLNGLVGNLWKSSLKPSSFNYCNNEQATDGTDFARRLFFPVPSQVNFLARAIPIGLSEGYSHPDLASLIVGAKVMSSCFLHREIREKGGAYGGGCSVSSDGVFGMTSYRDPRLQGTLDTFEEAFHWLFRQDSFGDRDVLEAKLSVFSGLDKPVAPHSRGVSEMFSGIPYEMREQHRQRLLAVDRDSILNAFTNHVLPNVFGADVSSAVAALGNDTLSLDESWTRREV